jgi:peptide/nickel transport system ATP-binding protein
VTTREPGGGREAPEEAAARRDVDRDDDPLVSVRGLRTYYDDGGLVGTNPPVRAVDGVSLDIHEGETVGLVGESGSGKTTLGETVLGLSSATEGVVEAEGRDLTELSRGERRQWQREASMVFQDPEESLNERMTVGEIVREPLDAHDWPRLTAAVDGAPNATLAGDVTATEGDDRPDVRVRLDGEPTASVRDQLPLTGDDLVVEGSRDRVTVRVEKAAAAIREDRVRALLERVGLRDEHFYRYPHQFSGGQRQRVGIARALALEPTFVVLDEPVSALDVSVQARIINLLDELQRDLGLTYLFIAHDLSVVRHIADRVAVMYLGTVVESGPTEAVFADPQHPYTVSLLSAIPGSGSPWDGERVTLRGTPPSPRDPPAGCPFATRCPAKIRPDGYDLPEAVWRALDALRVVLRTRARAETSALDRVRSVVGLPVDADSLATTREELFGDHDLPPEVGAVVDRAFAAAQAGEDRRGARLLAEEFGSRCDESHPEPRDGPRTNRCLRREPQYEDARTVVERRERADDGNEAGRSSQ